jgi:hypothetical protein
MCIHAHIHTLCIPLRMYSTHTEHMDGMQFRIVCADIVSTKCGMISVFPDRMWYTQMWGSANLSLALCSTSFSPLLMQRIMSRLSDEDASAGPVSCGAGWSTIAYTEHTVLGVLRGFFGFSDSRGMTGSRSVTVPVAPVVVPTADGLVALSVSAVGPGVLYGARA